MGMRVQIERVIGLWMLVVVKVFVRVNFCTLKLLVNLNSLVWKKSQIVSCLYSQVRKIDYLVSTIRGSR